MVHYLESAVSFVITGTVSHVLQFQDPIADSYVEVLVSHVFDWLRTV